MMCYKALTEYNNSNKITARNDFQSTLKIIETDLVFHLLFTMMDTCLLPFRTQRFMSNDL